MQTSLDLKLREQLLAHCAEVGMPEAEFIRRAVLAALERLPAKR